ncbi:LuxR C-terminal-related transcriptional regulator [Paucibacter sp. DJ4R-1]|nr:LuxR C-terminal-related transcriptional regulator [Paucibacter sp. DJ4R-1]
MKHASAVSHLRSLAGAGLPPESFIPAVLEALHDVIPSDRNLFDWTDPSGGLVRYFFEGPIDHQIARHYFEEFHNKREVDVMPAFREAVTGRASVLSADQLDHPKFYNSALYNEIWRPQRLKTRIEAIVRQSDGSPLGSLVLYRGPGDKKFSRAEERLLKSMMTYIRRGLVARPSTKSGVFASHPSNQAFVCLGLDGSVTHLSEDAHRLLVLAHGDVTQDSASRPPSATSFPALGTIWRQWNSQLGDGRGCSLQVRNAWGQFYFEACGLKGAGDQGNEQLHICVKHYEFESVALHRAISRFELTPTQQQVCRLLHAGYSQSAIADILKTAPSTVVDHVRKIYLKLDVHSVLQLVTLINRHVQPRIGGWT